MFDLTGTGRLLLIVGVVIALVGGALLLAGRLPWLGRLPGDIHIQRGNFSFSFPLATALILSIIVTVVLNLVIQIARFLLR
jgi:uncharacterized membrane protein YidH (DUF202 family)